MSDRAMILKLVEEGEISSVQADELLAKLELLVDDSVSRNKVIRVKMEDLKTKQIIVDSRAPLAVAKMGLKMGRQIWTDMQKQHPDLKNFKISFMELYSRIQKDEPGIILDLTSRDSSKKLQAWLE